MALQASDDSNLATLNYQSSNQLHAYITNYTRGALGRVLGSQTRSKTQLLVKFVGSQSTPNQLRPYFTNCTHTVPTMPLLSHGHTW